LSQLEDLCHRFADRTAVVSEGLSISYASLLTLVDLRQLLLEELGATRVAYQLDNGVEWVVNNLALLFTGTTAVPIPHFFSAAQRDHVLDDSGADLFIGCDAPDGTWQATEHAGVWQRTSAAGSRASAAVPLPRGTALITYTSGTTGRPKGVCLSVDTLLDTAGSIVSVLSPLGIERHMSVLPLSLLLENVAGLLANLLNGGTTVVEPLADVGITGSSGLDLGVFLAAQNATAPHSLILVPQLLLALTTAAELGLALPDSYRFVAVGGARVPPDLLARARAAGIPAYEGYGLTECGSVVSLNAPGADRPGSVGRPLPHARIECRNGEILVRQPVHLGYAGRTGCAPTEVATGDLGELDHDGFLHVSGRRRHHYITAYGRNLSPEWIESELTTELAIGQAAVFGEAQPVNVALLVPRMNADANALREAVDRCNARLPDYARVHAWQTVDPSTFTAAGCLTDNGRVRRARVAEHFADTLDHLFGTADRASAVTHGIGSGSTLRKE